MATLTLQNPIFGYVCEVDLPLHINDLSNGKLSIWDDGTSYDVRRCMASWILPPGDTTAAREIIYGQRGSEIVIAPMPGFFPFGPDLGDEGDFTCSVVSAAFSGALEDPKGYHQMDLELVYSASPAYSLPGLIREGNFAIGDTTGLMQPQQGFQPVLSPNRVSATTRAGAVQYVDSGAAGDSLRSSFAVTACPSNAANLLDKITGTIRGSAFTVAGHNPFAPDSTSTAKLSNKIISIAHNTPNRMSVSMEIAKQ